MVHYGKHIIDPETGLCEICDRGAIFDFQHGKRPGRQFLYSNQDGKFTYRPADGSDDGRYPQEEISPRYARKPLYPEPTPRTVVQEEPVVKRKVPRRDPSPVDDYENPASPRVTTFYYVDSTGQMVPRYDGPPEEPPRRRYLDQNQRSQNNHPTRKVQRRARTPPPPASESWRSRPPRQIHSDTKIVHQRNRSKPEEVYYNHSPRKAEMYHFDQPHHENQFTTISYRVQEQDNHRKQRQLEPIQRKYYAEPEPTVPRKVYKKLPDNKPENNLRLVRKVEKIYPQPGTYNQTNQHASLYHLRSKDEY